MAYFAAFLTIEKQELVQEYRANHRSYLEELTLKQKVFKKGPFTDGLGGMVIYIAENFEEAKQLSENDPHVIEGAVSLELREWGAY
ncbi:YciI family protein [Psychrobacillus sp. BM2]|uniref:YciI family protein n=1 Tax=Psychrobacillus sp. BM2 TaxID=3400421 RepID=UPI003B02C512